MTVVLRCSAIYARQDKTHVLTRNPGGGCHVLAGTHRNYLDTSAGRCRHSGCISYRAQRRHPTPPHRKSTPGVCPGQHSRGDRRSSDGCERYTVVKTDGVKTSGRGGSKASACGCESRRGSLLGNLPGDFGPEALEFAVQAGLFKLMGRMPSQSRWIGAQSRGGLPLVLSRNLDQFESIFTRVPRPKTPPRAAWALVLIRK